MCRWLTPHSSSIISHLVLAPVPAPTPLPSSYPPIPIITVNRQQASHPPPLQPRHQPHLAPQISSHHPIRPVQASAQPPSPCTPTPNAHTQALPPLPWPSRGSPPPSRQAKLARAGCAARFARCEAQAMGIVVPSGGEKWEAWRSWAERHVERMKGRCLLCSGWRWRLW
ncbi:hypothetical protein BS50DRAFT_105071 [Corynespora cassiicola Philippines]|uniref:Uncharacterized protein n=1 Tax=Corynespora cassiicola Philippines TaxID=1448308 RepID=A0A2T2NCJ6_CORCC|nr:hypothetical protein BS50DRAFT_105071 [Corynespora cassiicola Philippines]